MTRPSHTARAIVARFGGHPASALEIDLESDAGAGGWLLAACLLAGRQKPGVAEAGFRRLREAGLADPARAAAAAPEALVQALQASAYREPEAAGRRLWRVSRGLAERYGGSLEALAREADCLEDLAQRIAALASGVGAGTVVRVLRPLRDRWIEAAEVPLAPAARAAAVHLGWLGEGQDSEGEPGALRAFLADEPDAPPLADVEAALERLGARACLRERTDRCPLQRSDAGGPGCPAA